MNKYLTLITLTILFGCKPIIENEIPKNDEIKKEQKALIIELSSTKCGACGEFGRESFEFALRNENDKIIGVNIHVGRSELIVPDLYLKYENFYKLTGTPTFLVNHSKTNITTNIDNNIILLKNKAKLIFEKNPIANSIINIEKIENNQIFLNTTTQFFETSDQNSEYKLNVLLLENKIGVNQDNHHTNPNPYVVLDHVLRANITEFEGISILSPQKNQIIKNEFVQTLNPDWNQANLNVVVILYKRTLNPLWKEGSQNIEKYLYEFINASKS